MMEADEKKIELRRERFQRFLNFVDQQRFFTWTLSFLLLFAATWSVVKDYGLPGGTVFSLIMLYIGAILFGWLIHHVLSLPPLLGMLVAGLLLRNIPYISTIGRNMDNYWSSVLRMLALTVLLLLAGLGMDPRALRRLKYTIVLLGVWPFLAEALAHAVLSHFILGFSWAWGFLLGFALAGASGAIIIPGMLALQQQRLGHRTIPTLTIAACSFDDILAILGVGLLLEVVFGGSNVDGNNTTDSGHERSSTLWQILAGPVEIVVGAVYGAIAGALLWYIPSRNDEYVHEFRAALLFGLGTFAMFGSQFVKLEGAGAFGCVIAAFVAGVGWRKQEREDDKASRQQNGEENDETASWQSMFDTAPLLTRLWETLFEPLLFVLIGAAVPFDGIDWSTVLYGLVILAIALAFRSAVTIAVLYRSGLDMKEKIFIAITWWAKAGLQAAIGPLALDEAHRIGAPQSEVKTAQKVLTLAVLSILLTAPLGAINVTWGAKKLLSHSRNEATTSAAPSAVVA